MTEKIVVGIKPSLDVQKIREDFPILNEKFPGAGSGEKSLIYLDNAATTQKPKMVLDALMHYYQHENAQCAPGHSQTGRAGDSLL